MLRFLGRKYGYYPTDAYTAYQADQLCDDFNEAIIDKLIDPHFTSPHDQKAQVDELLNSVLPPFLDKLEVLCGANTYLLGE